MVRVWVALAGVLWAGSAGAASRTYAVAPAERGPGVAAAEDAAFYQAVLRRLAAAPGVKIMELKQLKLVFDQRRLAMALTPGDAGRLYVASAARQKASDVILPGVSKLESDYLLSLRLIAVSDGTTQACTFAKTRLPSRFPPLAADLVDRLLAGKAGASPEAVPSAARAAESAQLRADCRRAGAERLFPSFWRRCEALREKGYSPQLTEYYVDLLHLASRAKSPPAGMVFVPGGSVAFTTSAGRRRLWVEPFLIDRCEVSVGDYARFLSAAAGDGARPITSGHAGFNKPPLPVTGVPWTSADAFARRRGARLPTLLQWLRAAEGAKGGNLAGAADGWRVLAPAGEGGDVAACGAVGLGGNVREWTGTWYAKDLYAKCPADAPRDPPTGALKHVAGRGWRTPAGASATTVERVKPGEAFDDIGFRCVRPFFAHPAETE